MSKRLAQSAGLDLRVRQWTLSSPPYCWLGPYAISTSTFPGRPVDTAVSLSPTKTKALNDPGTQTRELQGLESVGFRVKVFECLYKGTKMGTPNGEPQEYSRNVIGI